MLENILIDYFGLKENWNDDYEKGQKLWNNAYDNLVILIYDLQELGVITNANEIIDELDKIDNEVC